jgi:hypothetical protein
VTVKGHAHDTKTRSLGPCFAMPAGFAPAIE